jgi:geranylgeranyl diphosphate synthase type II
MAVFAEGQSCFSLQRKSQFTRNAAPVLASGFPTGDERGSGLFELLICRRHFCEKIMIEHLPRLRPASGENKKSPLAKRASLSNHTNTLLMELKSYLATKRDAVERALDSSLPRETEMPVTIHKAMRYSLFAGGKRLRPILCLAASEAICGADKPAMPLACALELIHTYSLVHDDLPCMDDDDLRRGRPTCHKVFGEGVAVLAGDALLTQAFEVAAQTKPSATFTTAEMLFELARASGSLWLIAGQVMDLEGEGKPVNAEQLRAIHERKTAALLGASVRLGAMAGGATKEQLSAMAKFGHSIGLAFQIIDDILDVTSTEEEMGKSVRADAKHDKATYPKILGLEKSRVEAKRLTDEALAALKMFDAKAEPLRQIASYMLARTN